MTKLDLNGQTSPAQTVQSGPVRLSIAAGTVVRLTVGDALLPDDAGKFLRVTRLKEAEMEEFAPSVGALAMYAMGPFEAAFEGEAQSAPHVSVSFENEFSLNAGQKVTVLALGTYLDPDWLSPSKFESIGEATVSDDGQTIELTEAATGSGLRHLTWLALRP